MFRIICGIALFAILSAATGCGGGGGTDANNLVATPAQNLTVLPAELTGDWTVSNLELPNDLLAVQSDGQVLITGNVAIGTCSPQGILNLNGGWRSASRTYSINGVGNINGGSRSLSVQATVLADGVPVTTNSRVTGTPSVDAPPAAPNSSAEGSGSQRDAPPPPPTW